MIVIRKTTNDARARGQTLQTVFVHRFWSHVGQQNENDARARSQKWRTVFVHRFWSYGSRTMKTMPVQGAKRGKLFLFIDSGQTFLNEKSPIEGIDSGRGRKKKHSRIQWPTSKIQNKAGAIHPNNTMAKRIKGAMTCRRLLTLLIVRNVGGKPGGPTIQRFTSSESGVNVGTAGDPKRTNIYKA